MGGCASRVREMSAVPAEPELERDGWWHPEVLVPWGEGGRRGLGLGGQVGEAGH